MRQVFEAGDRVRVVSLNEEGRRTHPRYQIGDVGVVTDSVGSGLYDVHYDRQDYTVLTEADELVPEGTPSSAADPLTFLKEQYLLHETRMGHSLTRDFIAEALRTLYGIEPKIVTKTEFVSVTGTTSADG